MRLRFSLLALFFAACPADDGGGPIYACDGGADCAYVCSPAVDTPPVEGFNHVEAGTTVNYRANPPASGNHWPYWKQPWGAFPDGVPREQWMHNLEHGGIVLLYNCPSGCQDVVDQLTALMLSQPPDKFNEVRMLLVPDGKMPHKVAAVAWGWRWQGDVVDKTALQCFINARYDRGRESIP